MFEQDRKYVYSFQEGNSKMKALLGGKGANLAQMANNGIPVPPGFIITTEACLEYLETGDSFIDGIWAEINRGILSLEKQTGKTFGKGENPLLVSVRSGAPVSMPGMMDTILNLGLNPETAESLKLKTSNSRFVLDSWRRFIQMFGNVTMGIPSEKFEKILTTEKKRSGFNYDYELSPESLERTIARYLDLYWEETGEIFPQDPLVQLRMSVKAVFSSWNTPRAQTYRKMNDISPHMGTAVNIVSMVYGNMGDRSGTGVCFSRDPGTGQKELYGEFLMNAQGEDVVSGARTPESIEFLKNIMPGIYADLEHIAQSLEKFYTDIQDIEFTIEDGKLYILQTRNGKRSPRAAVKIVVDLVEEGLIDRKEGISRIEPDQVELMLHCQFDPKVKCQIAAGGLAASPGAACGSLVFDPDEAVSLNKEGMKVILARPETTPDDIHGLYAASGVLTTRGGRTSHAAVVARGIGKPCVSGCENVRIDLEKETLEIAGQILLKGDIISIDGTRGEVVIGEVPLSEAEITDDLRTFLSWCDETASMEVWANADSPSDARLAREYGAKGIGLCRTEHMFMAEDRLPVIQEMIIAEDPTARRRELEKLRPMQKEDFREIFSIMTGLPVIIRLLDPPLHEFLPHESDLLCYLSDLEGGGFKNSDEAAKVRKAIEMTKKLQETNPMLGFRGCRLGIIYPEIYEMQVRAIFDAVTDLRAEVEVVPSIMIPLVMSETEFNLLREKFKEIAGEYGLTEHENYKIGTMIEIPRAAFIADILAETADFFSFGTNDLTQTCLGLSRDDSETGFLLKYIEMGVLKCNPFLTLDQTGTGYIMEIAMDRAHRVKKDISFGICGEHGGDPDSIEYCHSLGLHYVSCSPFRLPVARLAAAQAVLKLLKTE